MRVRFGAAVTTVFWLLLASAVTAVRGQNPEDSARSPSSAGGQATLAATVDGEPVTSTDVERILAVTLRGRTVATDSLPSYQAQALEMAIDVRLVHRYVERATGGADDADVEAVMADQKRQLESRGITFEEYLLKANTTEEDVRQQHAWNLAWNNYLTKTITDAAVRDFYEQNRAEYDGTTVRVRHILLRIAGADRAGQLAAAERKAADLRRRIVAGEFTFEEAARQFSAGPSRRHGGDLGFMTRHGQMAEPFAQEAFRLQPEEISEPVVTNFGVHLIQCLEIQPGDFDLDNADAKQRQRMLALVRSALTRETYSKISTLQRGGTKIEYAEDYPHFIPGTQQLAPRPGGAGADAPGTGPQ